MSPLAMLAVAFALAFIVESMTEYVFGTPMDKLPKLTPYKWTLDYIALAAGIGLSLFYKIDLVTLIQQYAGDAPVITTVGMVVTGLAIGRGSNFLHKFVSKFLSPNK